MYNNYVPVYVMLRCLPLNNFNFM